MATINDFTKSIGFPEFELLGKMKKFNYYIEKNISDLDLGIPTIIEENVKKNTFEIIDANRAMQIMSLFYKE